MDIPVATHNSERSGSALDHSVVVASGNRSPSGRPRHLEALTGLRIFAAVAVYLSHLQPPKNAPTWLVTGMAAGYAGVTIFFVLSGFVLGINYWDRLQTRGDIWRYLVARFARVYPVYLLVLTWPVVNQIADHAGDPKAVAALPVGHLFLHVFLLQAWSGNIYTAYSFVSTAWSVSVEIFLYVSLPILLPLLRIVDRKLWRTVVLIVATVTVMVLLALWFQQTGRNALPLDDPGSAHRWLYYTPLTRIGDFILGVMACRLYLRLRGRMPGWIGWPLICLPIVAIVILMTDHSFYSAALSWDVGYAIPGVVLIFGLATAPRHPVSRFLSKRPIVFLGEASYAFYLVQFFVIGVTGAGGWVNGVSAIQLVAQVQDLAVVIIVAVGLHVAVERPARVWLRERLAPSRRADVLRAEAAEGVDPRPPPTPAS